MIEVEHINEQLSIEWLKDPDIAYFNIKYPSPTREMVDAVHDTMVTVMDNWARDKQLIMVFDMTATNFFITPYMNAKLRHLYGLEISHAGVLIAVILKPTWAMRTFTMFLKLFNNAMRDNHVVHSRAEALGWIETKVHSQNLLKSV